VIRYPRESAASRGYDARWRKARAIYLSAHPICVMCQSIGKLTPARVVDHIQPHKGNQSLFWSQDNWQALCTHCHDAHKQRQERSGKVVGSDAAGMPVDEGHHWNR
jgi:5-methylcytosine-specific restriction enzyme A